MAREHGLFMSVMMVHEALCAQADFDNLCDTFNEQNVDAFIFLTPTDVMFAAACRARVTQPRVIVTATHGQMTVREGLGLISTENKRRTALVGIDQWGAMAKVVALLGEYGHKSALYFAGPNEWRDAHTRLDAWRKLAASRSIDSQIVEARRCPPRSSPRTTIRPSASCARCMSMGFGFRKTSAWSDSTTCLAWITCTHR